MRNCQIAENSFFSTFLFKNWKTKYLIVPRNSGESPVAAANENISESECFDFSQGVTGQVCKGNLFNQK